MDSISVDDFLRNPNLLSCLPPVPDDLLDRLPDVVISADPDTGLAYLIERLSDRSDL